MAFGKRIAVGEVTHNDTLARGSSDAHPISAITNLGTELDAFDSRISAVEGIEVIDGGEFGDPILEKTYDGGEF